MEVCPVTIPGTDHKAIHLDGEPGCYVIDKLGISPCANTCPGGIHVQGYIALIAQRRFQEAIDLIRESIPFPGICGRVCTHPCEVNCRRNDIDQPVAIRLLKRFVADWEISQSNKKEEHQKIPFEAGNNIENGKTSVAIVGAGPGGMAVANDLNRRGYQVTVYEKLPVLGGMMAVGIPRYRLPREIIDDEYQHIIDNGVSVKLETPIGPNGQYTLDDLFKLGHKAICLAVGAHRSLTLGIPGEELEGVLHGIDVLRRINIDLDETSFLPRGIKTRVAIIGGGNTAMDVSRSIKRLGIENLKVLYRRSRQEMPAMPEEIDDALQEGIEIEFLVSPLRILGDKEVGVSGLECIHMQLGEADSSGRRRPIPIAESEFILDVDLVILAIGQIPNLEFLDPTHKLTITRDQRINIRDIDFMTSQAGVFAVGDAVTRDKMAVIEAIGMGKRAASGIDAYLKGVEPHNISVDSRQLPVAHRDLSSVDGETRPRVSVRTIPMEERNTTFIEVEKGFTIEEAVREATRCLACGPCSECQACVHVCQADAILHEEMEKNKTLTAGAIIYSDHSQFIQDLKIISQSSPDLTNIINEQGIFYLENGNPLAGLGVINQAIPFLSELKYIFPADRNREPLSTNQEFQGTSTQTTEFPVDRKPPTAIGVFICRCGIGNTGQISSVLNTKLIAKNVSQFPGVSYVEVVPFSCSDEGSKRIDAITREQELNKVIIAGCTCCAIDQVCYSCSYQRMRCKENFNIYKDTHQLETSKAIESVEYRFVNIREQCAWIHHDDPVIATGKAVTLIAAALACPASQSQDLPSRLKYEKSTIILGNGQIVESCIHALKNFSIVHQVLHSMPDRISRNQGYYWVHQGDQSWRTSSLLLLPQDEKETEGMMALLQDPRRKPIFVSSTSLINYKKSGVFLLSPDIDENIGIPAVAASIALWLNHLDRSSEGISYVDPFRCRGCGSCIEVCEFGAPEMIQDQEHRRSWIDPALCEGCGICIAHCPSGAISAGYSTDNEVQAVLDAIFIN